MLMDTIEDLQKNPAKQASQPSQASQTSSPVESGAADTATQEESVYKSTMNKIIDFLRWFITVLEIALAIRFFFKLLGADPSNLFVGFLYALTDVILLPFGTIFRSWQIHPNNFLEWSTLVGMIIIWLLYEAVRRFLRILVSEPGDQVS
jgi:hypothetical protein